MEALGNLKDAYNFYYEDVYMTQKMEDGKWGVPKIWSTN
jgi:hypothetical protein